MSNRANQISSSKVCTMCHKKKSLSAFSRDRTHPDEYKSSCKPCTKWRSTHIVAEQLPLFKQCTACHLEHPMNAFAVYTYKGQHGYRNICIACDGIRHKRARDGQPLEKKKQLNEADCLRKKNRRLANPEHYRELDHKSHERHRDVHLAQNRLFYKNHPEYNREKRRRRDALKKQVAVGIVNYKHILERDGYYCYICNSSIEPHHILHFDHVVPLSRGGFHSEDNIKPVHDVCNFRKNARLFHEMTDYQRRGPDVKLEAS